MLDNIIKNKPIISIIIPVYNSEKYLKQCFDSIINQKTVDVEIICIDDKSTDKSLEILQKYASFDKRFKVYVNKENLGPGLTRNFGVSVALGEYIFFLDSDDWLVKDSLIILENAIKEFKNTDFISFLHHNVNSTTGIIASTSKVPSALSNKLLNIHSHPDCLEFLEFGMTKIINRNFLIQNKIEYKTKKCFEDVEFFLDLVRYAQSFVLLNDKISKARLILCGLSLGSVLMLRMNLIAMWIIFCIFVLIRCITKKQFKELGTFILYFVIVQFYLQ